MLLTGQLLSQYRDEIFELYKNYLKQDPKGQTFFAIIKNDVLQAVASYRAYQGGHFYLRGCVVKEEFWGKGFQRKLIRERVTHLSEKTNIIRVSIYPWNTHSIDNVLKEGFRFEKEKELPDGKIANTYCLKLNF